MTLSNISDLTMIRIVRYHNHQTYFLNVISVGSANRALSLELSGRYGTKVRTGAEAYIVAEA